MNKCIDIEQGSMRKCFLNGDQATIARIDDSFIVVNSQGFPFPMTEMQLTEQIESGWLTFGDTRPAALIAPTLSITDHEKVEYWQPYLTALDREDSPGSLKIRERVIRMVSMRQRSYRQPPSPSTLYSYYKRYVSAKRNVLAVVSSVQKPSSIRASQPMIDLFREVMDDFYLKSTGALTLRRCYEIMRSRFNKRREDESSPLVDEKMISQSQFYNWSNYLLLTPSDKAKKLSNRERNLLRRKAVQKFKLDQILERVEVDAVTINIGLLDEEGNYLGAPIVYAAIDCYSRAILGLHVQVGGGERSSSVLHLYHQLLKAKDCSNANCHNDWPMFGIPSTLVSDSGTGFSSNQVSAFLSQLHITNVKTEVRKPWKKPFIERFFRTLRSQLCSTLKGYVGKRTDQKEIDINMKDAACLTLSQFRKILTRYVVDDYHQRPHMGLNENSSGNLTPYMVWCDEARFVPSNVPANADQFEYNKGIMEPRKLQRQGVDVKGITYQSNELDALIIEHGLVYPVPCSVLFDEEDISSITVLINNVGIKVIVPAKGKFEQLKGKSLFEYKVQQTSRLSLMQPSAGKHVPIDEVPEHQLANKQKPIPKAKANNRRVNLAAIEEQTALVKQMHDAEFFERTTELPQINSDNDDQPSDDMEDFYESV
ncbi:DDE-type integrase/transposase/recombinase [Nitrincola schmidtii]|uniref:DDE-type integrase/transposase/recombinase n=1 Tax=Nitrincola schmidtii TaxID=1730894 RepID=UPI00124D4D15|nr:DDE-type integrase/transposase/recombinase [Nitrincola schmidtii]